ncbi:hypothetical protein Aperf_G00000088284 [Anoplocephala perfoliata]
MEHVSAEVLADREKSRQRSSEISRLMGQYLLKGWRMLGDSCPVCDTILFSNKDGSVYCIACNEVDNLNKAGTDSVPTGESVRDNACGDVFQSVEKQHSPDSSNNLSQSSLSIVTTSGSAKTSVEIDRKRRRSDNISELMGQYLLKGWRKLDEYCPVCNTVLLRNKEGNLFCVACDKFTSYQVSAEVPAQNNDNHALFPLPLSHAEDFSERERRRKRSDKISELMGAYLLKGWRMLQSCCPVCDTILFLNREGNLYCVACNEVDNQAKPESNSTPNRSGDSGNAPIHPTKQLPPDSSRPSDADKPPIELHHVESALRHAIIDSSQRLRDISNPKEFEQLANSIKSLSDALLNIHKCLSM